MNPTNVLHDKDGEDPVLGVTKSGFEPFSDFNEEKIQDPNLPGELRRIMNKKEPQMQNVYKPVFDEVSREAYIDDQELKMRLFEAKWNWHKDKVYSRIKLTTSELMDEEQIAEDYDHWIKRRVEYMYDYIDFDNEREVVRNRFLTDMHKKTTMQDVGEKLDEFIYSSKAAVLLDGHWDDSKHRLE